MATTEILLIKPLENLGNEGDQVKVRSGYARNYLLPKKIGIPMTNANKKQIEALQIAKDKRISAELNNANETLEKLKNLKITLAVKTGPGGKVFGSVTSHFITEKIKELGVELDKKQVPHFSPVKALGKHTALIRLHSDVKHEIEFEVVSENLIVE